RLPRSASRQHPNTPSPACQSSQPGRFPAASVGGVAGGRPARGRGWPADGPALTAPVTVARMPDTSRADDPAAVRERTVRTGDVELHVLDAGAGHPVVLSHGFPELAYSWRHQIGP